MVEEVAESWDDSSSDPDWDGAGVRLMGTAASSPYGPSSPDWDGTSAMLFVQPTPDDPDWDATWTGLHGASPSPPQSLDWENAASETSWNWDEGDRQSHWADEGYMPLFPDRTVLLGSREGLNDTTDA